MRPKEVSNCYQRARAAVRQRLRQIALTAFAELLGERFFASGFEVRERAGGNEEDNEQNTPGPAAEAEDRCADKHRAQHTGLGERPSAIACITNEAREEKAEKDLGSSLHLPLSL